jgi:hypothetical protein
MNYTLTKVTTCNICVRVQFYTVKYTDLWHATLLMRSTFLRSVYKARVKLSLCLTKHHTTQACGGVEVQFQAFLNSALEGVFDCKPHLLHTPGTNPGAERIGSWVDPIVYFEAWVTKFLFLLGIEPRSPITEAGHCTDVSYLPPLHSSYP